MLLWPFRALTYGLEYPTRYTVELEQRHHLYQHFYEASTWQDGLAGIRPIAAWSSSFRPIFGLHFFDERLMGPGTRFSADVGGGIDVVRVELHGRPTYFARRVQAFFDTVYDRRNDHLYMGIGQTVPLPKGALGPARYREDLLDVAARVALRASSIVTFSFAGLFGLRRFGDGESYNGDPPIAQVYCVRDAAGACLRGTVSDALVPGFGSGTQFVRAQAGVHLDLRDDLIAPAMGGRVDVEADYTHGLGDRDRSSYFRLRGAIAVSVRLWARGHALVLSGATQLIAPVDRDDFVPFTELALLGGPNSLRGFRWDTFRGLSSLLGSAEYRWPIWMWVDGSVFADWGGVFGEWYDGIGVSRMQPDVGFGVRVHTADKFFLRVQIAYGFGETWQFFVSGANLP